MFWYKLHSHGQESLHRTAVGDMGRVSHRGFYCCYRVAKATFQGKDLFWSTGQGSQFKGHSSGMQPTMTGSQAASGHILFTIRCQSGECVQLFPPPPSRVMLLKPNLGLVPPTIGMDRSSHHNDFIRITRCPQASQRLVFPGGRGHRVPRTEAACCLS